MGDHGDFPGGGCLLNRHRARPAASGCRREADPGGRGRSRHAGRGIPTAGRWWLAAARDLGVGRLRRAYGLIGRGVAAGPGGAVGAEAGGVCHRRRDACTPHGVVCRGSGRRRRARRTGRTGPRRGPGGMAADGRPVLPSPGQSNVGPAACAACTRSGVNGGSGYAPAAATPRAMTAVSLGSSGKVAPGAGRTTTKVPAQREPVGPAGADQGPWGVRSCPARLEGKPKRLSCACRWLPTAAPEPRGFGPQAPVRILATRRV